MSDLEKTPLPPEEGSDITRRKFLRQAYNFGRVATIGAIASGIGGQLLSACGKKEIQKTSPVAQETEKVLPLFEEPQHPPLQELIAVWEHFYRGEYAFVKDDKLTGHSPDNLIGHDLPKTLKIGQKLSGEYYPYIRDIFIQYGIPENFIHPFIFNESAWRNDATSHKEAKGLFQFVPETARSYGLDPHLSPVIDERCDPLLAAESSARFLQHLHRKYQKCPDSWLWTLAAYNMGERHTADYLEKCEDNTTIANYFDTVVKEVEDLEKLYGSRSQLKEKITALDREITPLDQSLKKLKKDSPEKPKVLAKRQELRTQRAVMVKAKTRWASLLERKNYIAKFFGIQRVVFGKNGVASAIEPNLQKEFDSLLLRYSVEEYPVIVTQQPPNHTLSSIAAQIPGVKVADIKRWNALPSDTIYSGQTLRIKIFGNRITTQEVCERLGISPATLFSLNSAICVEKQKDGNFPSIILPDDFQLYLPPGKGESFLTAFSSNLQDGTTLLASYRKPAAVSSATPVVAVAEPVKIPEEPKESKADKRFAKITGKIDKRKLRGQDALDALNNVSELYQKELEAYPSREQDITLQLTLLSQYRGKIQQVLAASTDIGASLDDDPELFLEKLDTLYADADKNNIGTLQSLADMYVLVLDRNQEEDRDARCRETLQDIQQILGDLVDRKIQDIKATAYSAKNIPISPDAISDIENAYNAARNLTAYSQYDLWSDESIPLLLEELRSHNLALQKRVLRTSPDIKKAKKEAAPAAPGQKFGLKLFVQRGETLYSLEGLYGVTEEELRSANPETLKDGLKARTTIEIPVFYEEHHVKIGETASGIAKKYGITLDYLLQTNPTLSKPRKLQAGQKLIIVRGEKQTAR